MIAAGTVQAIEVLWVAIMAPILFVEILLLRYAIGDRKFIEEHHIDTGVDLIARSDEWETISRISGTALLLAAGILAMFVPEAVRSPNQKAQQATVILFILFAFERLGHDIIQFRRRRKMLKLHESRGRR